MTNQLINELTYGNIKRLARYLSLPAHENIANPSEEWFREQEARLCELPGVCLRPSINSLNMINLLRRGLMKLSEKQSLPFVPDSAWLCRTHRALNPWRIRSLFALLASEVMDKFERMRRLVRNNSDLAQSPFFRQHVRRMTSIQALWMDRDTFEQLFGHAPVVMEKVVSQCEACICAVVGGDTRLLVDLRAHLLSRGREFVPVLLRVVEAWINAFEDKAESLLGESALLAEELRRIRVEIGIRRHRRRERCRQAGKSLPYSKAKHNDNSNVGLAPKNNRGSASRRPSAASGSVHPSTSRFGEHTLDTSYLYPTHSSRMPATNDNAYSNPFGDEHEDDDEEAFADDQDANAGNPIWMEQLSGFYERQAAQSNEPAFDNSSVHPAFRNSDSPSIANDGETSRSQRETIRDQPATPSSATSRDAQNRVAGPSSSLSTRAPPPLTTAGTSRREPTTDTRSLWEEASVYSARNVNELTQEEQRRLNAAFIAALSDDPLPQLQSSASSAYSVPASMVQRESRARSRLQELATPDATDSKNRPTGSAKRSSSRVSEAVSYPPPSPASNAMTQDSSAASCWPSSSAPHAPARTAVSDAAATAREAWQARFASEYNSSNETSAARSRRSSTSHRSNSEWSSRQDDVASSASSIYSTDAEHQNDMWAQVVDVLRGGRVVYEDDATTVMSGSTARR
ncbi:uncharacterized protein CTRU02_213021 [Colletotrichum truncatum]|uniref:Uncharacterized protein n=1 Tax=Colletotrichum truncatum TaxID=5467 RepID=A0ACC3YJL7_COLTU|nr:uncharacterized protein CTRU02_03339 [Colletotrichum truncatum]KAF6797308.1 hypothetical protein CTRU02_03339 [Colletotrichum truncatum]